MVQDRDPERVDYLAARPAGGAAGPATRRRGPRWLPVVLVSAAIGAAIVARKVETPQSSVVRSPSPTITLSQPSRSGTTAAPSPPSRLPGAVAVEQLGRPLLGEQGSWELFARGDGVVVGIQPALGQVTLTAIPPVASSGPVTFIAVAGGALIRPIDVVPGYFAPDGRPVERPSGVLDTGGFVFPGPDPRHLWVQASGGGPERMVLSQVDGRTTTVAMRVPPGGSPFTAFPDQGGYLVFPAEGGAYDVRPDGSTKITSGTVVAAGPTRFLVAECDPVNRCTAVVIDRSTGARHTLEVGVSAAPGSAGVISPDGAYAALATQDPEHSVEIIDLTQGMHYPLALGAAAADHADWRSLAWSPDSRWLFTPDSTGHLCAVEARTRRVIDLNPAIGVLLDITQVSLRVGQ